MSHSPPVKKQALLITWSSNLRSVLANEHDTADQDSKMGSTKPLKKKKQLCRSNLSWKTHQDFLKIPSLSSYPGNQLKMLLIGHLGIKCHSQYIKVTRLLQHSSTKCYCGVLLTFIVYHSLTHIQYHHPEVTPFINLAEVMVQELCYCNFNA